jgi:hypothetical protein
MCSASMCLQRLLARADEVIELHRQALREFFDPR